MRICDMKNSEILSEKNPYAGKIYIFKDLILEVIIKIIESDY